MSAYGAPALDVSWISSSIDEEGGNRLNTSHESHSLHILPPQLFGTQRLARHDWIRNYIDIPSYKRRILIGMFTVLAADVTPKFKKRLMKEIGVLIEN